MDSVERGCACAAQLSSVGFFNPMVVMHSESSGESVLSVLTKALAEARTYLRVSFNLRVTVTLPNQHPRDVAFIQRLPEAFAKPT